jgi:NADH-quinone oxidoreductase subunit A
LSEFFPIYIYFGLVVIVVLALLGLSTLISPKTEEPARYLPYESGIRTETHLFKKRFTIHHYLTALIFLIFDIEVIFLYPWAAVAKQIGVFALYEMVFFFIVLLIGFIYVWKKGGLQWE